SSLSGSSSVITALASACPGSSDIANCPGAITLNAEPAGNEASAGRLVITPLPKTVNVYGFLSGSSLSILTVKSNGPTDGATSTWNVVEPAGNGIVVSAGCTVMLTPGAPAPGITTTAGVPVRFKSSVPEL